MSDELRYAIVGACLVVIAGAAGLARGMAIVERQNRRRRRQKDGEST